MLPLELFENSLFFLVPKWGIMSCIRNKLTMSNPVGEEYLFFITTYLSNFTENMFWTMSSPKYSEDLLHHPDSCEIANILRTQEGSNAPERFSNKD